MKLLTIAVPAVALLFAGAAQAQLQNNVPSGYGTGHETRPLHGDNSQGMAGFGGGWSDRRSNGTVSVGHYQQILAGELAQAQQLLARVQAGNSLSDKEAKKIRSAMREDFIAWRKQFDPRSSSYKAMHDKWLVDEQALSPDAWAKQRVDWLKAQQEWIGASAG